jgi:hypothetical protein
MLYKQIRFLLANGNKEKFDLYLDVLPPPVHQDILKYHQLVPGGGKRLVYHLKERARLLFRQRQSAHPRWGKASRLSPERTCSSFISSKTSSSSHVGDNVSSSTWKSSVVFYVVKDLELVPGGGTMSRLSPARSCCCVLVLNFTTFHASSLLDTKRGERRCHLCVSQKMAFSFPILSN